MNNMKNQGNYCHTQEGCEFLPMIYIINVTCIINVTYIINVLQSPFKANNLASNYTVLEIEEKPTTPSPASQLCVFDLFKESSYLCNKLLKLKSVKCVVSLPPQSQEFQLISARQKSSYCSTVAAKVRGLIADLSSCM